jgi:hypothetical protein
VAQEPASTAALELPAGSAIEQPLPFETRSHLTVLPVLARVFVKRRLSTTETAQAATLLDQLQDLYELPARPNGYVTHEVFADGAAPAGVDIAAQSTDASLWFALTASKPERVEAVRATLGDASTGTRQRLNVGLALASQVEPLDTSIGQRLRVPHRWSLTTGALGDDQRAVMLELEPEDDGTVGLSQSGTLRLALPAAGQIGVPDNDPRRHLRAGVGENPPRIDDPALASCLVAWLRLQLVTPEGLLPATRFGITWAGVNAVAIEQRRTLPARILGSGDGGSAQSFAVGATQLDADALRIAVEDPDSGRFVDWHRVDDIGAADLDEPAFAVDPEAGTVEFGDGVHGAVPLAGMRIRADGVRAGGGAAGNLPAGSLKKMTHAGQALTLTQPLAMAGGAEAETLAEAERRIPAALRHRERVVTAADYEAVVREMPRGGVARVAVLPRFKPHERVEVPGVVSVMVWPPAVATLGAASSYESPAPRADRLLLEAVHAWLDRRRPVGTELYAIGCEYVPVALGIGIRARDGHAIETVLPAVRTALRRYLWALAPGGADGQGWPLGGRVDQRELEVVAARVEGVAATTDVRLFDAEPGSAAAGRIRWRELNANADGRVRKTLEAWQLPELLAVAVIDGDRAPTPDDVMAPPADGDAAAGVPIVPEVC